MKAHVVVDLGFGDAGKGLITDWLVRTTGARLVVRYNGGAQAGHNVVTSDGRHHTFAQFGAGSFVPGVRTFLSRHVVVHPTALIVEARALERKGVAAPFERIFVSENAKITTPFHQAANRLREAARGDRRHGSVGVGLGETVSDSLSHPEDTIVAGDLRSPIAVRKKLARVRERKRADLASMSHHEEWRFFDDARVADDWLEQAIAIVPRLVADDALGRVSHDSESVVYEGAQGVLIDETVGFNPHTTWSDCTATNALSLLREFASESDVERIGVIRTHMVRHGAGPLPTETRELTVTEHNAAHPWQGNVRYGWFDAVLVRYALRAGGGVETLAVTHADATGRWKASNQWIVDASIVDALDPEAMTPERNAQYTAMAMRARPRLVEGNALEMIPSLLGVPVAIVARGPTAADVAELSSKRKLHYL